MEQEVTIPHPDYVAAVQAYWKAEAESVASGDPDADKNEYDPEHPEMIRICTDCDYKHDIEVPLVWTFAFPGAEYWCPHCGYTSGMFGAGRTVECTPELWQSRHNYEQFSRPFLRANGILYCNKTKHNGEWISPRDLPQEEKDRHQAMRSLWRYGVTAANVPATSAQYLEYLNQQSK